LIHFYKRKCTKSSLFEVSRSASDAAWAGAKPLNCGAPPHTAASPPFESLL